MGYAIGGYRVSAADVDGDGDTDVLSISSTEGSLSWYDNLLGDGTVWSPHAIDVSTVRLFESIVPSDLDGDGDMDVLAAEGGSNKVVWYVNLDGDGLSWTARQIGRFRDPSSVFVADIDRDGDPDAVASSTFLDQVNWYENRTDLGFSWVERVVATSVMDPESVLAADIDGDGDVDIASASTGDDTLAWYENLDGVGDAWSSKIVSTSSPDPVVVQAADVNGDARMDLIAGTLGDDRIQWYASGFGSLASVTFRNAGTNPASYTAAPMVLGSTWMATVDLTTTGTRHGHRSGLLLPGLVPPGTEDTPLEPCRRRAPADRVPARSDGLLLETGGERPLPRRAHDLHAGRAPLRREALPPDERPGPAHRLLIWIATGEAPAGRRLALADRGHRGAHCATGRRSRGERGRTDRSVSSPQHWASPCRAAEMRTRAATGRCFLRGPAWELRESGFGRKVV